MVLVLRLSKTDRRYGSTWWKQHHSRVKARASRSKEFSIRRHAPTKHPTMEHWLLYETKIASRSKQRSKMHLCQVLVDRTELVQMPRQNAQIT